VQSKREEFAVAAEFALAFQQIANLDLSPILGQLRDPQPDVFFEAKAALFRQIREKPTK